MARRSNFDAPGARGGRTTADGAAPAAGASRRGRPARAAVYARLDAGVAELRQHLGGLPAPADAVGIWDDIWVRDAHNSTAIEGNTLLRRQVEELLHSGRAVGNRQLAEYMEVKGYADAARWVYEQALDPEDEPPRPLLTLTEVRHVHRLAMGPVWEVAPHPHATPQEAPGSFREHDIALFPGGMVPPSHPLVPATMRDWLDEVQPLASPAERHVVERLAGVHAAFERVHPFLDGNGRTGRLLLNLLLLRLGYPPAVIQHRDRARYLSALRRADAGEPGMLAEIIARAVADSLYRFVVPALAGPSELVPLASLTSDEVSAVALRNAAARGRLRAVRGDDGQWRSSRSWVGEYIESRHRRNNPQPGRHGISATSPTDVLLSPPRG